jgi:large subunit ribosomal protein L1
MSIKVESVTEAIKKAKEVAKKRNFIQSVDLTVNLKGLDLKKPENRLNEIVKLPIALSKAPRICIIAYGDLAVKAKDLKMERVIDRDELDNLTGEKKALKKLAREFDFFIARTDMMPTVGKVMGKYLAPRGKMPKPIPADGDLEAMVKDYAAIASVRLRKDPTFHVRIGTEDMPDEKISQNAMVIFNLLENKLKKGYGNIKNYVFKTTMGKPVKIEVR